MTGGQSENPNLDVLRATAVLAVLVFHVLLLFGLTPGSISMLGKWGVLVFFVHTSLVLMHSLERHANTSFSQLYWSFLTRRLFRIYPLCVLIVLVVWALALPVAHLSEGRFVGIAINTPTLLENLMLVQNTGGVDSVLAPLWSLPFEMQMYLVLPFLFVLAVRPHGLATMLAVSLGAAALAFVAPPPLKNLIQYVPCFLGGVIAFTITRHVRFRLPAFAWPLLILASIGLYLVHPTTSVGWLLCLGLGVAIPHFTDLPESVLTRAAKIVARYSYGIYLTHFICLWFGFQAFAGLPQWASWLIFAVTAVALPVALYHLIEEPMIRFGKRVAGARAPAQVTASA